jgi:translation elongation factor EF-Tu-like GTPase
MIYLVKLTFNDARTTPAFSNYRPDWVSEHKPELNCAAMILSEDKRMLKPGEEDTVLLIPLVSEEWKIVRAGDKLEAREGIKTVAEAVVLQVYDLPGTLS